MAYLAHREGDREQQLLEHLQGAAALAKDYAAAFGAGDEGYRCGMLHDLGKYSEAFQRRLAGESLRVDHSAAGAVEARALRDIPAMFCVAGHHGGLPDWGSAAAEPGTLAYRMLPERIAALPDYGAYRAELAPPEARVPPQFTRDAQTCLFFIRMLYSCLVDADFLDTEAFVKNGAVERGSFAPLAEYRRLLTEKLAPWLAAPASGLGGLRTEILRAALAAGKLPPGLFTLTAPTGSGKTFASLAFALEHARERGLRRVIYVIPYCSILEQTQAELEKVFGPGSVVAHYANVEYRHDEENTTDRRYLAAENWDAPIILTTTVQFFESLYGNRSSRCRKLHNIANSVLVFDEAQMLPTPLLRPCLHAVCELVARYGCTAVLCTATQPALTELLREWLPGCTPRELCPRPAEMYALFRRVRYETLGQASDEELARRLTEREQALCVVNRRLHAQTLYALLPEEGRFHLSTTLCPADRRALLAEIRRRLREGLPCRVVSTSLIEAGVDVDFPAVYRELAGLDSIIQSGGRCNREGAPGVVGGVVSVFESESKPPRGLAQNIAAARRVLETEADIAAPGAVKRYFDDLYDMKGRDALDAKGILRLCQRPAPAFATLAEAFRVIDDAQCTVYIPRAESRPLLERLEREGPSRALMRKLGLYAVGVYPEHYQQLLACDQIKPVADGAAVLTDESLYDGRMGLSLAHEEGVGLFG